MLQFDQFLYSCIFHLPAFFSAMETFSSASIKCICFFITIIGVGIWVFRRIFFFSGLLMLRPLAQCEGKVLLLRQHLWQGGLLLMCSMLTLQNWTEICQLLLSGPSPNYQIFHWLKRFHLFCLDNEKLCCKFLFLHWLWNLKQTCSIIVHNSFFLSICLVKWIHWFLVSSLNLFLLRDGLMV